MGIFIVFIAYSGLAMAFSLVLCLSLAASRRDGALAPMAAGIAAIIIASIVQALRSVRYSLVWEFDYNSVYHFILMGAVLLLNGGVKKALWHGVQRGLISKTDSVMVSALYLCFLLMTLWWYSLTCLQDISFFPACKKKYIEIFLSSIKNDSVSFSTKKEK